MATVKLISAVTETLHLITVSKSGDKIHKHELEARQTKGLSAKRFVNPVIVK